jgi:hypothetical protein
MAALDKAQAGLSQIEEAISELLQTNPSGLTNSEITSALGLESDQKGKYRNYLAWSLLGRMMESGKVARIDRPKTEKAAARSAYQLQTA